MNATETVDKVCAAAVEVARQGLIDAGVDSVGEHLGVLADGDRAATHLFACTDRGYPGWTWSVTVVRPPRGRTATVAESCLLPGTDAVLAPAWVPWSERLQPGDLGVGDVLPAPDGDPRLAPGWSGADDLAEGELDQVRSIVWEAGLDRRRVLSLDGLYLAADRWVNSEHGPDAAVAQAAPGPCGTCGFRVAINGLLGQAFGLCANEYSPSDGSIVSLDHGCGAHSEASTTSGVPVTETAWDSTGFDELGHA